MLSCPNCGHQLTTRNVKTSSSGSIQIDACESCGGVFFDQGEINRVPKQEALKLAHEEHHTSRSRGTNHCPKCGASLERFWGESVPSDVYVLRCPECSGTWFTQTELEKFKSAQDTKIDYFRTWKIPLSSLSSVLLPVALLVTLAGVTFITVEQVQKQQYYQSLADEILTQPSVIPTDDKTAATIVFATKKDAITELVFSYGDPFGDVTMFVSDTPASSHSIVVRNLEPGKTYSYKIRVITGEEDFYSREFTIKL